MNHTAITVIHNEKAHRFEVLLENQIAVLDYTRRGNDMYFTHTGVPPAFEAQGIAAALTKRGLDFARDNGLTVHPLCRYTAVYMRRHKEYQSLLVKREA